MKRDHRSGFYITVALALASGLIAPWPAAEAQLGVPSVQDTLGRLPVGTEVDRRLRRQAETLEETAETLEDELLEDEVLEDTAEDTVDTVEGTADGVAQSALESAGTVLEAAGGALRRFVPATAPGGATIEADTLLLLVDQAVAGELRQGGFAIVAEREFAGLGKTMVTVRRPAQLKLPQALEGLANAYPDAAIDYNHVYRYAQDEKSTATTPQQAGSATLSPGAGATRMRIGIIDSAVSADHFALRESVIVARDLAGHEGQRPLSHGTAIASLVSRSANNEAVIYSASVFFQAPGFAPGATTEGLIAALDWLAAERVDVINMSLSGPGNALLETALTALAVDGPVVVAAVGNNGPAGEPLYPAAYDGIIGVTAVDRDRRIFRNANRGAHVDYAALGVNVKVADSDGGGWRIESGTSMASPHVATVIARTLVSDDVDTYALLSLLTASAEDLGKRGFDPVFGHGLITDAPVIVSQQ